MNGLFYLGHLVYLKNQLNRRRRRFYSLMNPEPIRIPIEPKNVKHFKNAHSYTNYQGKKLAMLVMQKPMHPLYSIVDATAGYEKAKLDMKSMTAHMRQIRTEIGANLIWGDSGNIQAIELDNKRYGPKEIQRLHECYIADEILLA